MSGHPVLVTGGAGFIGSHLVDRLVSLGYRVVVLDDFSSGSMENLSSALASPLPPKIIDGDVADPATVEILEYQRPRYVFHLAAQADVRHSLADPLFDARVNILGSLNVLEGTRKCGADRVVYAASGGTLYGEPADSLFPLDESVPHSPLSFYGVSKKVVIDYLRAQRSLYGLEYVALALANVYGPRQDPHGESGVVSIFAGNLSEGKPCIIFGDGNQTRDFVYVGDVVDAFVAAMTCAPGEILNISSGNETSIIDLYRTMAAILGRDDEPLFNSGRPGELMKSVLSNAKAGQVLGWSPGTPLKAGLEEVVGWVLSGGSSAE